jgi:hypothetical protein
MRHFTALILLAALGASAGAASPASAQTRSITCESRADEREDCYAAGLDQNSVSLDKQYSKSSCVKGTSWGTSRDHIWVSRGCRAKFSYRTLGGSSGGRYGKVKCESRADQRQDCAVSGLDERSVTLERKLSDSDCIKGQSWGTGNDVIWVTRGCRAEFGYTTGSGWGGSGGANGSTHTLTCESRGNQQQTCPVTDINPSSVRLTTQLSDSDCINGRTWGTTSGGIWVSGGCRARFSYRVR